MEYKVGDKVLCKKDYIRMFGNNIVYKSFISGRIYKVSSNWLYFGHECLSIKSEFSDEVSFFLNDGRYLNINYNYKNKLYDYFYTKEEERKFKIENINVK